MMEKPIVVNNYQGPNEVILHLREDHPEKFLGDA